MYNRPIGALDAGSQMLYVGVLGMKIDVSLFKLKKSHPHPKLPHPCLQLKPSLFWLLVVKQGWNEGRTTQAPLGCLDVFFWFFDRKHKMYKQSKVEQFGLWIFLPSLLCSLRYRLLYRAFLGPWRIFLVLKWTLTLIIISYLWTLPSEYSSVPIESC